MLDTVRRRRLFPSHARVAVALSGGPDSTALLSALAALFEARLLAGLCACHVDHQLRADSAADGDFSEELCRRLGVPFERAAVTVAPGHNVQAAARRARYAALRCAMERLGASHLATGHNRGDQAETVVQRLLRGAGARGLAGIPPRRGRIVRPLIDRSRGEILGYLRDQALEWREDPSNSSTRYLRNRIRAQVLPVLEELAPGIERRLARAADLLRDDERALERLAARAVPKGASRADLAALLELPPAAQRRAVRRLWCSASGSRRGLGADHVQAVMSHLRAPHPKRITLPGGREARIRGGAVEFGSPEPEPQPLPCVELRGPGLYALPGAGSVEIAWRSSAPPPWPLLARGRRPGDRFRPAGGAGSKKLKAWFIDKKVPRARRDALVVIADVDGRVLCVPELGALASGATGLEVIWRAR